MKKRFSRTILMIAGICTVIVILLSQSFYQPSEKKINTAKTEKGKDHKPVQKVSFAPSEVVPSPAVQLVDKNLPSLLKIFSPSENTQSSFFPDSRVFISFFKALLKATISPNAP